MEQALAIKLEDDQIRYLNKSKYQSGKFYVARLARIPNFPRSPIASRILTGSYQQHFLILYIVQPILSLVWSPRLFSRRFPWHPLGTGRRISGNDGGHDMPPHLHFT